MLTVKEAFSSFSVDDIAAAKAFYGDTLGLKVQEEDMGTVSLRLPGGGAAFIYPKEDHAAASFTVLNFKVSDIDKAVDALAERGVKLDRYPGFTHDEKGIVRGEPTLAWFKDPAGNVLSLLQE
jgi:predicted enzyme related to lactoylglutathione lyase